MSEAERIKRAHSEALANLRSSIHPSRLKDSVPIDYDDMGMPIVPPMPELDKDALMASMPAAAAPQRFDAETFFTAPPQRPNAEAAPQLRQPVKNHPVANRKHPVVQKILEVFGLKKNKREDLEIYVEGSDVKVTYTMTLVAEELQSWALDLARSKVSELGLQVAGVYFELLSSCCAVVAIDNEPIWQIFDIEPTDRERQSLIADPLDVPARMRTISAKMLADLLWSETRPIGDKLSMFYNEKVADKKIMTSLDDEALSKKRFVCPLDGCDNYEYIIPDGKTYYCKYHGAVLVETVDLGGEGNIPLA